jgi:glyceraldehyde-3-phosphate dehydrogenase (NADP+)
VAIAAARDAQPFFLAGRWERSASPLDVLNPFDGTLAGQTWLAGDAEFERAVEAGIEAAHVMRRMPAFERAAILVEASRRLAARRDDIARQIAAEAGKPLRDATTEADRAVLTFHAAAQEATRIGGEVIPLDLAAHGVGRLGLTRRYPVGLVAAISPFNFPLNLAAHKLAPAIAAGNAVILKPATKTPLSGLVLAEVLHAAGAPPGSVSVLPMARETGDRLVTDDRFKLLTFTGSSAVGWAMKARAGRKKVVLELGGNAGVIVDDTADLDLAVKRIVAGGFAYAGQSCISVQRVYGHRRIYDELARRLVAAVSALKVGNPLDPDTDVGPMIEASEAARIEAWVAEAVRAGGRLLTGGRRLDEALFEPTILAGVPPSARVCQEEVFAPLVSLSPFDDFSEALAEVNRSKYGLQAGVFTRDLDRSLAAFDTLEVGGVMVNDVPTFRLDHMPYGGVKDSGLGREGPRYTIEEMTELRLLVINRQS